MARSPSNRHSLQSDLEWINQRALKGEAVEISGLDHAATPKTYRCATLQFGTVLAIAFSRWNPAATDPATVFLFQRSGRDWKWREGLEYGPRPDHDDLWDELNHLVVEKDEQWTAKTK